MSTISAERILTAAGWVDRAEVRLSDGRVEQVGPASRAADVCFLAPGFVDIQVNGFGSVDLATSSPAAWPTLASALLDSGVTSWLPTLVSRPLDAYAGWLEDAAAFARRGRGPRVLGVHLEGPWLGELVGAHADAARGPIDLRWCQALPSTVRIVTLGPERAGALEAIRRLRLRGIVVAAGHSSADHPTAQRAFDAGVSLLTHCFNRDHPDASPRPWTDRGRVGPRRRLRQPYCRRSPRSPGHVEVGCAGQRPGADDSGVGLLGMVRRHAGIDGESGSRAVRPARPTAPWPEAR